MKEKIRMGREELLSDLCRAEADRLRGRGVELDQAALELSLAYSLEKEGKVDGAVVLYERGLSRLGIDPSASPRDYQRGLVLAGLVMEAVIADGKRVLGLEGDCSAYEVRAMLRDLKARREEAHLDDYARAA